MLGKAQVRAKVETWTRGVEVQGTRISDVTDEFIILTTDGTRTPAGARRVLATVTEDSGVSVHDQATRSVIVRRVPGRRVRLAASVRDGADRLGRMAGAARRRLQGGGRRHRVRAKPRPGCRGLAWLVSRH